MSQRTPFATADLGQSEGAFTEPRLLRFRLHGFEALPHEVGKGSFTPSIECFGYKWNLQVYPGGMKDEHEGKVSVLLFVDDEATPSAKFTLRVLKSDGTVFDTGDFTHKYETGYGHGAYFLERTSFIEHCLVDGTLTVEVDLQVRSNAPQLWEPKTSIVSDLVGMLESGKKADVTFVLGKERIVAHRLILAMRAPTLAALCDDAADGKVEEKFPLFPSRFKISPLFSSHVSTFCSQTP